jgi:hypothetical protein
LSIRHVRASNKIPVVTHLILQQLYTDKPKKNDVANNYWQTKWDRVADCSFEMMLLRRITAGIIAHRQRILLRLRRFFLMKTRKRRK